MTINGYFRVGELVTVSDGTPRPPDDNTPTLAQWASNNYQGVVYRANESEIGISPGDIANGKPMLVNVYKRSDGCIQVALR
jgi:hypothetical protein